MRARLKETGMRKSSRCQDHSGSSGGGISGSSGWPATVCDHSLSAGLLCSLGMPNSLSLSIAFPALYSQSFLFLLKILFI